MKFMKTQKKGLGQQILFYGKRFLQGSGLLILLSAVLGSATCGKKTKIIAAPPKCPEWSAEAIEELQELVFQEGYYNLIHAIGRQEQHCEALEVW
jgi:hypothetical protein